MRTVIVYKIELTKPDGTVEVMHFLDGDSLVVEFPPPKKLIPGKHVICKYRIKQLERSVQYWKSRINAPKFSDVDLSEISTDALMREIGSRADEVHSV